MKKIASCLFALLVLSAASVCAQEVLVATLEHEGNVSVYYGGTAFTEAHKAATHGDIITLSAGTFNAVNITKAITLRGAGMVIDGAANRLPTALNGDFSIDITEKTDSRLFIEGIYSNSTVTQKDTLTGATFSKCQFYQFHMNGHSENCAILSCRIQRFGPDKQSNGLYVANSVVLPYDHGNTNTASLTFTNCNIYQVYLGTEYLTATYKNCILLGSDGLSGPNSLTSTSTAYNNVFAVLPGCALGSANACIININNKTGIKSQSLFGKDKFDLTNDPFTLVEGADTLYVGTDGTQVGIHGGSMPYNDVPSNPQITRSNIAAKTTADGKLSVDIKVEVQ